MAKDQLLAFIDSGVCDASIAPVNLLETYQADGVHLQIPCMHVRAFDNCMNLY